MSSMSLAVTFLGKKGQKASDVLRFITLEDYSYKQRAQWIMACATSDTQVAYCSLSACVDAIHCPSR
eukprot:5117682-Amphidinium_carterae.4